MKITCTQENFKKAIFYCERIVSKQNLLSVLNNILIETEKGGLKISATNLEIGIITRISAKMEKEGKITIPAKLLSNFLTNLPGEENILLATDDQNLKIKSGSVKAEIKGLSAEEFPLIPKKTSDAQIKISVPKLKLIISKILTSIALNEVRQELTGVDMVLEENNVFFASTDSFRLSEYKLALKKEDSENPLYKALISKRNNIIIPASTLAELARVMSTQEEGEVEIIIEESQIFFEIGRTRIVSRLINGKYPEYKHIIPKDFSTRIVGEKSGIQSAVKMASIFSAGKTGEINLKSDSKEGKIFTSAKSAEVGENVSELEIDVVGPDQEITLNSKYLLDGLNNISSSKVAILANNNVSPIALKEINEKTGEVLEDYIYIVMPIKN